MSLITIIIIILIIGIPLFLFVAKDESAINVQVRCDNMELAGDVVQDIAKFFKITELESAVNFPQELEAFEEVLKRVAEYNSLRVRMSADMADDSQRVKVVFFPIDILFLFSECYHHNQKKLIGINCTC